MTYDFSSIDGGPQANAETIARCRAEIESPLKRRIRAMLLPIVTRVLGLARAGEGFQWGLPTDLPRGAVSAGRYSYIGAHCVASGPLLIGDLCMISSHPRIKYIVQKQIAQHRADNAALRCSACAFN